MEKGRSLIFNYGYIALVVSVYWIISISMVFVNKTLFSSKDIHLEAPLFITFFQCLTSVVICVIISHVSVFFPNHIHFTRDKLSFNREIMRQVFPVSVLFTGMIVTNNLCLKYVDVSFYYIGRSLTTVFNILFTYIILGEKTSCQVITCCGVIFTGFWIGVDQENVLGSLSVIGTIYGVLGSLILSLYSIQTKKVLPVVNQDIWRLTYCLNVYSFFLFIPLMVLNGDFVAVYNYDRIFDGYFWLVMCIGGICGFAIGSVTALQIKVTSPLTHNISGTAKSCFQTVLASYWFSESKGFVWWMSNFVVLGGSMAYARIKQLSMQRSAENKYIPVRTKE